MSWTTCNEPVCETVETTRAVDLVIEGRARDLGGFSVRRILPATARRMVGPFIFFDQMGPADFEPGRGIDVRPHPHVNLATVTYLFEGEILHRDSLGSEQAIRPGEINWMTAGRGIVHSERTGPETRASGGRLSGIQLWVALPKADEETAPEFLHYEKTAVPTLEEEGVTMKLLAGDAYGERSPVRTFSPLVYLDVVMEAGSTLRLPDEHEERAVYVVDGEVSSGTCRFEPSRMLVMAPRTEAVLRAERPTRLMLVGGAPLDGPRYMFWNFVSSSEDRIEQAKRDWTAGSFPKVPGDTEELIPLPD